MDEIADRYFQVSERVLNGMGYFIDDDYLKQYGILRILKKLETYDIDGDELLNGDRTTSAST